MYSSTGNRIMTTVVSFLRWRILKVDVEMAFHQSGPADMKVYVIPQLFMKRNQDGHGTLLVIKIVDEILATSPDDELRLFVEMFGERFKLGTFTHSPGNLRFY